MTHLTAIDLFCGAGGLSEGLTQAGFNIVFASDINPCCVATYKLNHPETHVYGEDIRSLSNSFLEKMVKIRPGQLDLLAGGPPCQGFSINAPVRSENDHRNHLFWEFLRIAEFLKPKFILIENVPGIVSYENGKVVQDIVTALKKTGYEVNYKILLAAHYGVPQARWRTFFLGTRLDQCKCIFPEPTHNANSPANFSRSKELCFSVPCFDCLQSDLLPYTTVWDAISDLPEIPNGGGEAVTDYTQICQSSYQVIMRENSRELHNHQCNGLGKINLERLKHIPQGGSWRDIPFDMLPTGLKRARRSDHTKRYGRLSPDGLCSTIMTKCDPHWGSFFHPFQDRVLSVREAARVQSFPDQFVFTGSIKDQYEQIGNAVPPLLARAVGLEIVQQFTKLYPANIAI